MELQFHHVTLGVVDGIAKILGEVFHNGFDLIITPTILDGGRQVPDNLRDLMPDHVLVLNLLKVVLVEVNLRKIQGGGDEFGELHGVTLSHRDDGIQHTVVDYLLDGDVAVDMARFNSICLWFMPIAIAYAY